MIKIKELKVNELQKIQGGFSVTVAVAVVAAAMFISGLIEGIVFPRSCSNE